jgi:replicative DNA helicase
MHPTTARHLLETALLAGIFREFKRPWLAGDVVAVCPPECFAYQDTRMVAEAMAELVREGATVDLMTVVDRLSISGKLARFPGGAGDVAALAYEHDTDLLTEAALLRSAVELRDEAKKAVAQQELPEIMRQIRTQGVPVDLIAGELRRVADNLESVDQAAPPSWPTLLDAYREELEAERRIRAPIKTPWRPLNRILRGGIMPGELAVLAARPSVGKSAFALNFAWSVACSGKKALFQSLEMPRQQLIDRVVANVGSINLGSFREGLSDQERRRTKKALESMRRAALILHDDTAVTPGELRRRVRMEQRNGEIGLVVVDYLQLMTPQDHEKSREREVAAMSRALKLMAKELLVPVLVLAQLNRKNEEAGREPLLSDLRESGAIEQDADIVIFLHQARPSWHPEEPVKVIVAKGRSSGVGREHLLFQRRFQRFLDADAQAFEEAARREAVWIAPGEELL